MMQDLFTVPGIGLTVHGFGAMLVLAFLSSTMLAAWRCRREGLDPEIVFDMAFWVFLGGLGGARLFYVIQYWGRGITSFLEIFQFWKGGIVFYGSIIGGAVAFFVYHRLRPFPLRPFLDVMAPSIAVGILFGRLGCFLNGCCFGDTCNLPWAVAFPKASPPWDMHHYLKLIPPDALWSLRVHPTQLYASLDGLILLILLSAYYPLRRRDGEVMGLLMFTYPVTRVLIEYLRNDEGVFFAGLTISQNISLALLLGGVLYWAWLSRFPRKVVRPNDFVSANLVTASGNL
jgi:phosphatidylglycerol:prolipoprotein diacylglycerol transferase